MKRRDFLRSAGMAYAALAIPTTRHAGQGLLTDRSGWRTFEVITRVEVLKPSGTTRVWLPAALLIDTPYQKTIANTFDAHGGTARLIKARANGFEFDAVGVVAAEYPPGISPTLTLTSRIATRNYAVDLSNPGKLPNTPPRVLDYFRRSTRLLPTDGIVKATAIEITKSARTDSEKALAIYDWIVDNTVRDPKTRGCGLGDIRFMLESKNLGGKCADLNALYVGLARAAGLPARDVYGLRVAKSEFGYKSLGTSSEIATRSQHCRAEVHLGSYGWVPVDPADVRKVMLEEPPGNLPLSDDLVRRARARLFGSWEMNWMAYNFAHDVVLPGSSAPPVGFFMYPEAKTGKVRLDSLDPDNFKYEISAKEIVSGEHGRRG